MRIRDVMTRDFRVIDAGWPREGARDAVARFTTPFIVVRRSDVGGAARLYYVFRCAASLKRLEQSQAADTREALGLHECGAAPTVSVNAALQPSTAAQVVLGAQGPAGLVVPRRRTRGGTPRPRQVPAQHSPDLKWSIEAGPVTRHLIGELPSTIAAGATVSLLVSLGSVAPHGRNANGTDPKPFPPTGTPCLQTPLTRITRHFRRP